MKYSIQQILEFCETHQRWPSQLKLDERNMYYQASRLRKRNPEFNEQIMKFKNRTGRPHKEVQAVAEVKKPIDPPPKTTVEHKTPKVKPVVKSGFCPTIELGMMLAESGGDGF